MISTHGLNAQTWELVTGRLGLAPASLDMKVSLASVLSVPIIVTSAGLVGQRNN